METTRTLQDIIEQVQLGLTKALFKYQTAQYHYAYAVTELDKYQDEYFKAKDHLYYVAGGY